MKILYVEDDPIAREFIEKGLKKHGFVVDVAPDATSGAELALTGEYDLLVLDVMLPDRDGFSLLKQLRSSGITTPALYLSARGEVTDRIKGLDLGADDYLSKPFSFAELIARIRAIARRSLDEPFDGCISVVDLLLDLRRHKVWRAGQLIDLTPKQFSLMEYLLRNAGFPVSRSMIIEKVWGYGFETRSNAIDVQINYLRKKVDHGFSPKLIHTVKGIGYVLEDRSARPSDERHEE
jgi:two-component system copper resistance phosphate regulon response regulator CusR